jgi:hypothetical protein
MSRPVVSGDCRRRRMSKRVALSPCKYCSILAGVEDRIQSANFGPADLPFRNGSRIEADSGPGSLQVTVCRSEERQSSREGTIQLGVYRGSPNQVFELYPEQNCFLCSSSGRVLDIGESTFHGPDVTQCQWHGGSNQRWDYYRRMGKIRSHYHPYVLDIKQRRAYPGATLIGAPETESPAQRWLILSADDLRVEFPRVAAAPDREVGPEFARFGGMEGRVGAMPATGDWGALNYPSGI